MTDPRFVAVALHRADDGSITGAIADEHDQVTATWDRGDPGDVAGALAAIERSESPRWVWWERDTALGLALLDIGAARGWDLGAVHRLLHGGWRSEPGRLWASAHDLDLASIPERRPVDLFSAFDHHDPDQPIRDDGHLDAEWTAGAWSESRARAVHWARLALDVRTRQQATIAALGERPAMASTARSESTASLLAAELETDGLPFDRSIAEGLIERIVGPRPRDRAHASALIAERDGAVRRLVPDGDAYDLRSPEQVKSMLRRCGIEVPDTRSWRLERLVDAHPVVGPLLDWRRAERIATTFGYGWIDDHVAPARPDRDDATRRERLRGEWSSSDGAAGRMTATAGLHNMPAELRPAIVADPGHRFVRADLGQIEPRVLAAVSGDHLLARAADADDMYAPVAERLGVERDVAKVAVLGAMYGQTTGVGAAALRGLEREYPIAMAYLRRADEAAQVGRDLRTVGGRLVRMSSSSSTPDSDTSGVDSDPAGELTDRSDRARAAARGRYGRNAVVQGAAAELFKVWAVLVRARGAPLGASIVLCLHDELLVHVPSDRADETAAVVDDALVEAAARWRPAGSPDVRFLADTSVVERWSDVT